MKKDFSRRDFLKKALTLSGLVAVSWPVAFFANRKQASASGPETASPKARPWCMVIDLKKCDGCVPRGTPPQCTQACILGHFSPRGQRWIEVYQVELPGEGSFFLPTPCFQCENA